MRELRLGSYSMAATCRNAYFVAFEIDDAVGLLVPTAIKRELTRPLLVRPPVRFLLSTRDFPACPS